MDSKTILAASSAISSMAEQNISEIEKVHSRIKMGRFIGQNIFLFASLFLITGCVYFVEVFLRSVIDSKNVIMIIILSPLLVNAIAIFLLDKKRDQKLVNPLISYITSITLVLLASFIFYELSDSIFISNEKFLSMFILLIEVLFLVVFLYFLFQASKSLAEVIVQTFFKHKYTIIIQLLDGDKLNGELLTITAKSDYVVITDGDMRELLVKNHSISYLEIKRVLE
ncbi:hypothetical protein [Paenibacillus sp. FSL H7-0331]|uniref:hypothetical protein n=1 Tax=Paenibacillus sp. FSL H7-0331 TaxID=1920421 RepID=UPI00096CE352|nr:hypothetical protein [Paenibacillus sp. FSL H7-0331]OME97902.1 hypothetical protein BK127_39990 [Paenibacillus sp. FSL H7-0331]